MRHVTVTERDNSTEVRLVVGDELTVLLEVFPGTGYSWCLVGEADLLKPTRNPFFRGSGESTVGLAEQQVLTFSVEAVGERAVLFEYRRRWEKHGPAQKTFSIHLIVLEV